VCRRQPGIRVRRPPSSSDVAGLSGAFLRLPQFASGILGGAVIDRLGYRRVSVAADLISGAGTAGRPARGAPRVNSGLPAVRSAALISAPAARVPNSVD